MAKIQRKPRVILIEGLPGSGKSTRAEELVVCEPFTARVNKDKIREMVAFVSRDEKKRREWAWEPQFAKIEQEAARVLLRDGFNVVVDDTNLKEFNKEAWRQLARDEKADFEIISLLDVPIEECVRRDALRPDGVGRGVIYSLAASMGMIESGNFKVEHPGPYGIVDIDGTLANIDHRLSHISDGNADWDSFFQAMGDDEPIESVIAMLGDTWPGLPWVAVTGRPEPYRQMTEDWLRKHVYSQRLEFLGLLMRQSNDKRSDVLVKGEILQQFLEADKVKICVDDRPVVLRMWAASGIRIVNVGNGKEF